MAETVKIVIDADDKASKEIKNVNGALDKLGGLAKGVLAGGAAVGIAAIYSLGNVLVDSVQAAMEAQEAQAQLAAVIKSTGGVAGVTADMANRLATELQNVTRFEDDAVLGAENVLLTFTNIGREVFPDAVWAAADLSQALGQDLQTSVMQLGKALNDPIQGMAALQRVGVAFTDAQKEQIKALVEAGQTMEAQKIILQELQKEFGGSAVAAGETFAGKLDILKNKSGDLKERIGGALIPALQTLVEELGPKLIEWGDEFARWVETDGAKAIRELVDGFLKLKPEFDGWVETIKDFLKDNAADLLEFWDFLQQSIRDVEQAIKDVQKWWTDVTAAIQAAIDKLKEFFSTSAGGAGGGGSGAGGPPGAYGRGGTYTPPPPPPGGRGYSMPITVNVNIAGNADPRTTRGAVLDALSLARARGMV